MPLSRTSLVLTSCLGGPQKGITKLKRILEDDPNEEQFNAELYMMLYTYASLCSFLYKEGARYLSCFAAVQDHLQHVHPKSRRMITRSSCTGATAMPSACTSARR